MTYRQAMIKEDVLRPKRIEFAKKLGNIIRHGKDLIYLDESAVNSYMYQERSWGLKGVYVEIPINTIRYSCTLIGSIGLCLTDGFCITKARSTNREDVLEHLKTLKRNLRNPSSRPYIVLDNCTSHHSKVVAEYIDQNFKPLFMPGYSPFFNSIEQLWSYIKRRIKHRMIDNPLKQLTKDEFEDLVMVNAKETTKGCAHNVVRANHDDIRKWL